MIGKRKKPGAIWLTGSVLILCFCFLLFFSALAADQYVFDNAGLWDGEQNGQLEEMAASLSQKIKMETVIVTINDAEGKSATAYADDYYDEGGFGTGSDHSGALFLIDMDNREIYISTTGKMIRYLTDERIERILDDAYDQVAEGNYADGAKVFLKDVEHYVDKGIVAGQYNYDTETGKISVYRRITWLEALIAVVAAAVIAFIPCKSVINGYGMKKKRKQALNYYMAYRSECNFNFRVSNDYLINQFVTKTKIPRNTGGGSGGSSSGRSSTHSSSSGRSHGGGGRSF